MKAKCTLSLTTVAQNSRGEKFTAIFFASHCYPYIFINSRRLKVRHTRNKCKETECTYKIVYLNN